MIYRFFSSVESGASSVVSDRLDAHSYFVPFSCRKYCETADFYKERAFSDRIVSLNGDWNFAFFPNGIKDEFDSDTDFSTVISVPSSWESGGFLPVRFLDGYEFSFRKPVLPAKKIKKNPTGVYRKSFRIGDLSKKYFLVFSDVRGKFEFYVNGVLCGRSEVGNGEFEVTSLLCEGTNEVTVAVAKYSSLFFLSGGAGFDASGITGDVYLVQRYATGLRDYSFYCYDEDGADYGKLDLFFDADNDDAVVRVSVEKDGEILYSASDTMKKRLSSVIEGEYLPFLPEDPVTYDVFVEIAEQHMVTECTRFKVAFGYPYEIFGSVNYCGNPLKILGADYNAVLSPEGKPMKAEDYERDFDLMKKYGFNTVFLKNHYDPEVLRLAAKAGLFTVTGMGTDTSGVKLFNPKKPDLVTDSEEFLPLISDRAKSFFYRDRACPGHLGFSFGRENGRSFCIAKAAEEISAVPGSGILFLRNFFAPDGKEKMAVVFRPSVDGLIDEINRVGATCPVFMSEYALSGGIGSVNLGEFCSVIEDTPCCLGGSIGYFTDDVYAGKGYRDCGLFAPDRSPYAGAKSHRYVNRCVVTRLTDEDKLEIFNKSYFFDTSDTELCLEVVNDGKLCSKVRLDVNVPPRSLREFDVFSGFKDGETYLNVICRRKSDGEAVSREQHIVSTKLQTVVPIRTGRVSVHENFATTEILFRGGSVRFSKSTGTIVGYTLMGKEILYPAPERTGGACFNTKITRPFVRNILNPGFLSPEFSLTDFDVSVNEEGNADVQTETVIKFKGKARFIVQDKYVVYSNGVVEVFSVLNPYKHCPPVLDCFGKQLRFYPSFDEIVYYGRGEGDNYIDLCEHEFMGTYACKAWGMNSALFGQECGNRTDVHYVVVKDRQGDGFMVSAVNTPFQARISVASDAELAESYRAKRKPVPDGVYLEAASVVSGYGSGGQEPPMAKYTVKSGEYILHFKVLPLFSAKENEEEFEF